MIQEVPNLEIPEVVIDRAHVTGPYYTDKKNAKKCVNLSLFALQRSVIALHLTELEGL